MLSKKVTWVPGTIYISENSHEGACHHLATPHYMDGINGGPNDIGVTACIINSGTNYRGHSIPPFRKDGELSQNELAFLKAFEAYMKNIHDRLTEETDKFRSNRDINKYEFNKIIADTVMKDIYYPLFLDEYINCGSEE